MSLREEDKSKSSCSGRGLGVAAAAVGVGVGAALYYFFSKRTENPGEDAAASGLSSEQPHAFRLHDNHNGDNDSHSDENESDSDENDNNSDNNKSDSDENDNDSYNNYCHSEDNIDSYDSYLSMSEHSTTDTSFNDENSPETNNLLWRSNTSPMSAYSDFLPENNETGESNNIIHDMSQNHMNSDRDSDESDINLDYFDLHEPSQNRTISSIRTATDSDQTNQHDISSNSENDSTESDSSVVNDILSNLYMDNDDLQTGYLSLRNVGNSSTMDSDSETATEWDITASSLNIPREESRSPLMTFFGNLAALASPRLEAKRTNIHSQTAMLREQAFRERTWTLEECSICFEVMLKTQELMSLPCTHNFHAQCIMPWLQEKQTCPNCRKVAE